MTADYSGVYGDHVIVDCGDGWSTLYGHMSELRVKVGDAVDHETVLGISGSTGFSTGEHLHFEYPLAGHTREPGVLPRLPHRPGDTALERANLLPRRSSPVQHTRARRRCAGGNGNAFEHAHEDPYLHEYPHRHAHADLDADSPSPDGHGHRDSAPGNPALTNSLILRTFYSPVAARVA